MRERIIVRELVIHVGGMLSDKLEVYRCRLLVRLFDMLRIPLVLVLL